MTLEIDLNCDIGEGDSATDLALLDSVTSASIACGGHAGDEASMRATVRACIERGVSIGAHPGYPDRARFGRASVSMGAGALEAMVEEQVAALSRIARDAGARVSHVKPHGALYHDAMTQEPVARAIGRAVRSLDPSLILVGQAGSRALEWWRSLELEVAAEGFCDRVYEPTGALRSRALPGALNTDPEAAAEQAERLVRGAPILTPEGPLLVARPRTLCIHSDSPGAPEIARVVRLRLERAGITVAPMRAG